MIPKPVHEITFNDLQALVGVVREGRLLEFKQVMPGKTASDIVPFLAGTSSLANTSGGDFIIGICERDGLADSVPGLVIENIDGERLRLEQLLAYGLEPRLPRVDIEIVSCPDGRKAIVVRVPRSWVGPHRVKANDKFYGRNSGGKYPLDVGELRTAFLLSDSVGDRVRVFRTERLFKIAADETPVPLPKGGRLVLHIIPFATFADRRSMDVVHKLANGTPVPLPLDGATGENRPLVNLEGFLNYRDSRGQALSYAQIFRSGVIEGVSLLAPDELTGKPYIPGTAVANKLVFALWQYLDVLSSLEIGLPVFAFVSLVGVDGCTLRYGVDGGYANAGPRAGDMILLPEAVIEALPVNAPMALKPALDTLWNAFNFFQSDMFDGRGEWKGRR